MELKLISQSVEETLALGVAIAQSSDTPLLLALSGQLGGGKTHLTKGLADALEAAKAIDVTSPTFTLLQEYRGAGATLFHIDLYRIESIEEAPEEILDALEDLNAWVSVEWADRHGGLLPTRPTLEIEVSHQGEDARSFVLRGDDALISKIESLTKNAEGK